MITIEDLRVLKPGDSIFYGYINLTHRGDRFSKIESIKEYVIDKIELKPDDNSRFPRVTAKNEKGNSITFKFTCYSSYEKSDFYHPYIFKTYEDAADDWNKVILNGIDKAESHFQGVKKKFTERLIKL